MAVNPSLTQLPTGMVPTPFQGETLVLQRPGVDIDLDGVHTSSGRWKARGTLFLTNVRIVFVADAADQSGLAAFDVPLVYVHRDAFKQPVFGANRLEARCWPAVPGGGPLGSLPPHDIKFYFSNGGFGTFAAFYYRFKEYYEQYARQMAAEAARAAPSAPAPSYDMPQGWQSTAFVDPSDPTTVFLVQPVVPPGQGGQQLPEPRYSPLYGRDDEPYQAM